MKISILGTGRWASCLAHCLDKNNHEILMWKRLNEEKGESKLF